MAIDYFLKLGDIKGESMDGLHPETIEVLSWSLGASNPTKRTRGKVSFQDFHFSAHSSTASEQIFARLKNNATVIKLATLYGVESDETGAPFDAYVIKLVDCIISTYGMGSNEEGFHGPGGSPPPVPIDNVSLKVAGYDVKKNVKV